MRYFNYTFALLILGTFLVFFFNISVAHAAIIIRPPNNLGLVGYWSFDEGRGTRASDLSGNGNNGEVINEPAWMSGKTGGALSFDGNDQYVAVPNLSSYKASASTISAWINPEAHNNNRVYSILVGLDGDGSNPDSGYHSRGAIRINPNGTVSGFMQSYSGGCSGTLVNATSSVSVPLNEWSHVSVVMEFSPIFKIALFINGEEQEVSSHTSSCGNDFNWLWIGRRKTTNDMVGKLDEMRLYNRALSEAEIFSLYDNTRRTVVGETSTQYYSDGLVAHYTFDGGTLSGTTISDVVGENHGTLSAGPVPTLGRIGQGMLFNGSSGGVDLGNPSALQITGDQTIAMWLYPENFSTRRNPFAKAYGGEGTITQETNGALNYYYGINGGNGGTYQGFNSNAPLVLNEWNHIALVRDLTSAPMRLRWYINGVETSAVNASYAAAVAGTNPALIGQGYVSRYDGIIDDVRIYNRALPEEEIQGLAGAAIGVINVVPVLGSILHERWEGIGGTAIGNIPVNDPPDYTGTLTLFEIPSGWGDNYGSRLRGYLHPETTGNYTFWLASDDAGELWLSTDSNPGNKVRIAHVSTWTSSRQWNKEANQKSVEVPLVAGQKYYIEGLMKEGGGGDNMAVSWKLGDTSNPSNGDGAYIIPGTVLSPWAE